MVRQKKSTDLNEQMGFAVLLWTPFEFITNYKKTLSFSIKLTNGETFPCKKLTQLL